MLRAYRRSLLTCSAVASLACLLAACSGSTSSGSAGSSSVSPSVSIVSDPLLGTWHTGHLTPLQLARAVQAGGAARAEGRSFASEFGARRFVVISMHFLADGNFVETESTDGGPTHESYLATYRVSGTSLRLTSANPGDSCVGTYAVTMTDERLRLHVRHQCSGGDAPFNTALFGTFPFTRR